MPNAVKQLRYENADGEVSCSVTMAKNLEWLVSGVEPIRKAIIWSFTFKFRHLVHRSY